MGRRLSTWLVLVRLFQVLGSFIPAAMNGWLLYFICTNKLGPSNVMLILEVLEAIVFVYSLLSLFVLHTGRRSRRAPWMISSMCLDVVFVLVNVTIISLLAFSGLPSNCAGLTTTTFTPGDKPDIPSRGYTTIRFSNEEDGHRGELDKFCSLERGFYFCAILILLALIVSIILSICRICDTYYTRNTEIQHIIEEREELLKLELKMQEQEQQSQHTSPTPTLMAAGPNSPVPSPRAMRDEEAAIDPLAVSFANDHHSRTMAGPSTGNFAMPSSSRYVGANLAAIPEASSYHVPISRTEAASSSSSTNPMASLPTESEFLLSSTEMHANLAMVTDGSRYTPGQGLGIDHNSQLPPYSPGNLRRMAGHGDESNEIRLSEYVKGETRAQDMKDAGGF